VTLADPPIVIVTTVHVPAAVVVGSCLLVVGIAFVVFCARRYGSTLDRAWIVLALVAAAVAIGSAAGLVTSMLGAAG